MNTERPDNDDAAAETGAEEAGVSGTGGARDDGDGSGSGLTARRTPVIVASVAAAVLVVGGGGAYLAASTSGGSDDKAASGAPGGGGTPPPLPLDGYVHSGGPGIAPGEPNPYGSVYRADGKLPQGPGSAPVYRAAGQVTKDEVARLAGALGVDGTPVAQGQAWRIGAKDGAGPSLQVNRQAPGTWTFYRYTPGTDNCTGKLTCAGESASGTAADPVSEEAARKAAAPVLKAVGQDDAKVTAGRAQGANRVVNAEPLVGGLPTYGWSTGVTVGAGGEVVGASGQLKAPVKGDTYPVLDAKRTLELMNAAPGGGPVGIGGCASPVPHEDGSQAPCEPGTDLTSPEPKRQTLTVEKAVFGLAAQFVSGRQALVPSWLFEVRAPGAKDPFTVTHPAVDPRYITSATPPAGPTERPSPRPTGPDEERTGKPRNVAVDGYTAEGTELTVSFTGGVCADYAATASESGGKVTVKVTETPRPGKVCILIAKVHHLTVRLDAPLGDRAVVGTDGEPVPLEKPGARLPQAR
ncbi:hypothetical protein [Streptomyces sp. DH24]|uniref:hypothetical protein n=1 Tax=Streptomyces sp. DH24 TaxID=3040123 RepID=UPI002442E468|nr:hypothetical protein [Streptomyces sp. DH24]MDG9716171.1 hypothetical protein [Streptomyces sp. DH24]